MSTESEVNLTREELKFLARFVGHHTFDPVFDRLYDKLIRSAHINNHDLEPLNFTLDNMHYHGRPMVANRSVEL